MRTTPRFSSASDLATGRRVVAIGGGTGLAAVLRGLKTLVPPRGAVDAGGLAELVGIVTVTDDGGSSGRLRRELGVLPPGDIRNCLVALADDEEVLARLFQYRFREGGGLSGHSFGNLFLTALAEVTGDFYQAILTAESVLSVRGTILPATLSDVRLRGRGRSGRVYEGEVAVGTSGEALERLDLEPAAPEALPEAVAAIERADLVLLGPGSLYTSILPNLLIPGICDALVRSPAPVVLLLNLMTEPGETDGFGALAHLEAIERQAGPGIVDLVLSNARRPSADSLTFYGERGAAPVRLDRSDLAGRGVEVMERDLLATGDLIRHDPPALRRAVLELLGRPREAPVPLRAAR